jgi:hypothetical protein
VAVEPFPIIAGLSTTTDLPHGLRIDVDLHEPVAAVGADGGVVPVAADGTLLRGSDGSGLPRLNLATPPAGRVVTERPARRALRILAAAPAALRSRAERVARGPRGLRVEMRDGPALIFGDASALRAKWAAAAVVLADSNAAGARYVDVRVPGRPVAGGLPAERSSERPPPPPAPTEEPAAGAADPAAAGAADPAAAAPVTPSETPPATP